MQNGYLFAIKIFASLNHKTESNSVIDIFEVKSKKEKKLLVYMVLQSRMG